MAAEQNSWGKFFDTIFRRAKNNPHGGKMRSKDLQKELSRIDMRVQKMLTKINEEAETSNSPDIDLKIKRKLERTIQILTNEMMQLTSPYHRQKDIVTIKKFLNEQRDVIQSSLNTDREAEKTQTLDGRIGELHRLMASERQRIKRDSNKELIKFILTASAAFISLVVSIYALLIR